MLWEVRHTRLPLQSLERNGQFRSTAQLTWFRVCQITLLTSLLLPLADPRFSYPQPGETHPISAAPSIIPEEHFVGTSASPLYSPMAPARQLLHMDSWDLQLPDSCAEVLPVKRSPTTAFSNLPTQQPLCMTLSVNTFTQLSYEA